MKSLILFAFTLAFTGSSARGQRPGPGSAPLDSAAMDTLFFGPSYAFTGQEDTELLIAVFRRVSQMAETPESTEVVCIGLGRRTPGDAPSLVVRALSQTEYTVRPRSACTTHPGFRRHNVTEVTSGKVAFFVDITSLGHRSGDTLTVYGSYYVGPLWAAGVACFARRHAANWAIGTCRRTWVS